MPDRRFVLTLLHSHVPFTLADADVAELVRAFGKVTRVLIVPLPGPGALSSHPPAAAAEFYLETSDDLAAALCAQLSGIQLPNGAGVLQVQQVPVGVPVEHILESTLRPNLCRPQGPFRPPHLPPRRPEVLFCRLELENFFGLSDFDLLTSLLGRDNRNICFLMEQAGFKVDIGIKGVPHNDAPTAERLHVIIKTTDAEAYRQAVEMMEDLLQSVKEDYEQAHVQACQKPAACGVKRHEYVEADGELRYMGCRRQL